MKLIVFLFILLLPVLGICENQIKIPERDKTEVKIIAHRGNAAFCPENTKTSYAKAIDLGAEIIETDIRLTKDGIPVFSHDDSIDRVSNGTGKIQDKTLQELKGYDFGFGAKYGDRYKGWAILTLEEGLKFFTDKKAKFLLEIKINEVIEPACKLVKKYAPNKKNTMFLVWNTKDSEDICKYLKGYQIYHLAPVIDYVAAENKEEHFKNLIKSGITGFSINFDQFFGMSQTDRDTFSILAAKYKMPISIWTIDSTNDMLKVINYQVVGEINNKKYIGKISYITTNDPAKGLLLTGKNLQNQ